MVVVVLVVVNPMINLFFLGVEEDLGLRDARRRPAGARAREGDATLFQCEHGGHHPLDLTRDSTSAAQRSPQLGTVL